MTIWNRTGAGRVLAPVRFLLIASTAMASVLGTAGLAQPVTAPAKVEASDTRGLAVEEIIVTAQKRAQNLQDVPISIAVVSGEAIQDQNYRSLQDLSRNQPAFTVSPVGRGVRMSLRGISSGTNSAFDQSVVTFIDDVYHGKSRSSGSLLLDIDRIELLKGPQTTFFGNNAIAGAINVQSARPRRDYSGSVRALYGDHGEYAAEALVNMPLTGNLAVRAAGLLNGMDGYLVDRTGGGKLPHERNIAGRISALWTPSETFTLFLKAEATDNRNRGGAGFQIVDCPPRAPFTTPGRFCPDVIAAGGDTQLNNIRDQTPGQFLNLTTQDYQANASLDLGSATLTSVTAYSRFSFVNAQDLDGGPAVLFALRAPQDYSQFSQEIRLASNDSRAPLSYIIGGYYQSSDFRDVSELTYSFLSPAINAAPPFAGLRPFLPFAQQIDAKQAEETLSGFGSLTWRATDALSITAAARVTQVRKSINQLIQYGQAADGYGNVTPFTGATAALAQTFANGLALGAPGTRILSRSDSKFMPAVNIQYAVSPDIRLYASYSEGFKAGGFNATLATGATSDIPFNPEYVVAYEAGVRSELFDRRLLLNATAFRSTYRDLQVSIFAVINGNPISVVQNAASSVSQGIELESKFAVSRSFSIGGAMTFLDAHFKSFPNATPTATQRLLTGQTSQDLSGAPLVYSPKFSASFYAVYKHPIGDRLNLEIEANLLHQSYYYTADQIDPNLAQNPYDKIDLRAALSTSDDAWELAVIGKNITDRTILTSAIDSAAAGSYYYAKERPRSVVVQIRHKW